MDFKRWIAGLPVIGSRLVDAAGAFVEIPLTVDKSRIKVEADITVGDSIELTNTTAAKALASRLVNAAGAAFVEPPTQADVQALATQTTLASVLSILTPYPVVNSWDNPTGWKSVADPTAADATLGSIPLVAFLDGAMRLYYLGAAGQKREVELFMSADDGAAHDFAYNAFAGYALPANKTLAGYVSAWGKVVNQLRVTRDQDAGASQIRFTTEASWVLFSVTDALGAIVAPAVAGQCNVVARRVV